MSHLCLTPEESVGLMNEYYDLYMADVLSAADLRVIENLLGHRRPKRREAQRDAIEGTNYDTQY